MYYVGNMSITEFTPHQMQEFEFFALKINSDMYAVQKNRYNGVLGEMSTKQVFSILQKLMKKRLDDIAEMEAFEAAMEAEHQLQEAMNAHEQSLEQDPTLGWDTAHFAPAPHHPTQVTLTHPWTGGVTAYPYVGTSPWIHPPVNF